MDVDEALESRSFETLLSEGGVVNHYQPIVDLRSGRVVGVETLARLRDGMKLILPGAFLPGFDESLLDTLLFASLRQGLSTLAASKATHPDLFISFNVSPKVMIRDGFLSDFLRALRRAKVDPTRVMLEILENDDFLHLSAARDRLEVLDAAGVRIAIDDVGSGYSSLTRLRELPVGTVKLDQSFARGLQLDPSNIHFVSAMLSLSRGLGKHLIVEGVETPEITDVLRVLGAQWAQGHDLAMPMPQSALLAWLRAHRPAALDRTPQTLIGVFAAHVTFVEACRSLRSQPIEVSWSDGLRDPTTCSIGRYLGRYDLHDTEYGAAHRHFHDVIDRYETEPETWEQASRSLTEALKRAIAMEVRAPQSVARNLSPWAHLPVGHL